MIAKRLRLYASQLREATRGPSDDGIRTHVMLDTEKWARMSDEDVRYALKAAWRDYVDGWRPWLRYIGLAAPPAAPPSQAAPSLNPAPTQTAPSTLDDLRSVLLALGMRSSSALSDPDTRRRMIAITEKYAGRAREVAQACSTAFAEGRRMELEEHARAQALRAQQPGRTDATGIGEELLGMVFPEGWDVESKRRAQQSEGAAQPETTVRGPRGDAEQRLR